MVVNFLWPIGLVLTLLGFYPSTLVALDSSCSLEQEEAYADVQSVLAKRSRPVVLDAEVVEEADGYVKSEGRIVMPSDRMAFSFTYYRSTQIDPGTKGPLVFFYPGMGGQSMLERFMARRYARNGVSVVISHYFDAKAAPYLDKMAEAFVRTLKQSLALTDYFSTRPEVDANRLGLLGVSYGGIRGYHHMAVDPRIKGAVLMVAGAPLFEILAHSELEEVQEIREQQMRNAGISTIEEYLALAKQYSRFEAENILCKRKTSDFFLFVSESDTWVPSQYQWRLWRTLGKPETHVYEFGHIVTAAVAGLFDLNSTLRFFYGRWGRSHVDAFAD